MALYSGEVPLNSVVTFEYLQPFMRPPQSNCDTHYKLVRREPRISVSRDFVVECEKSGALKPSAREHGITLEFVNLVR